MLSVQLVSMNAALRDADRSRTAILDAAEELFAWSGPHQVSLADIAARAGVSRGLPSYFFGDKETLARTVMERAAAAVRVAVLDPIRTSKHATPAALLGDLVDHYIDYLAGHPKVVRLLLWDTLERSQAPPSDLGDIPAAVLAEAVKLLADRIGPEPIAGASLKELMLSVVALCLFPLASAPAGHADDTFVRQLKRHVNWLVRQAIGADT